MIQYFENEYGAFTVESKGASLLQLRLGEVEVLHDFGDQTEAWAQGVFMFPFPIRMSTGNVLEFKDQLFQWPINDERHKAALHGLTPWVEFELTTQKDGISCLWVYDGEHPFYPFPCRVALQYSLTAEGLRLCAEVENRGSEALPFHAGWHPYFIFGSDHNLKPIPMERLKKNNFSHPGERTAFQGFQWSEEVDGAFLFTEDPVLHIGGKPLVVRAMSELVQIFRPAGAEFVAIEPISGLGHPDFPWLVVEPGARKTVCSAIGWADSKE